METEMQNHRGLWMRGKIIGSGSFGTVSLATTHNKLRHRSYLPPVIAVKSADVELSKSLLKEKHVLTDLQDCPYIIRCYGDDITIEKNNQSTYNLLLEYASGGSLANRIKNSVHGLPESEVKCYTRSILEGLNHIHQRGYVHCDIKPHNILLVESPSSSSDYVAKLADFGTSKQVGPEKKRDRVRLKGTPLYIAPESVACNEYAPHSDVWALGCAVVEMLTGEPAWKCKPGAELYSLLFRIACTEEVPVISGQMSNEAQDFVKKCLVRDTMFRWTPAMLLGHPFLAVNEDVVEEEEGFDFCKPSFVQKREFPGKRKRRTDEVEEVAEWPSSLGTVRVGPNDLVRYWCIRRYAAAAPSIDDVLWI